MNATRFITLAALLCFATAAWAAEPLEDWKNLEQLRVGERIQVVKKDKSSHFGTFVALSDESLTLRNASGDAGFRREEILRVSRIGGARRGRAALIGLAIGGGAGAAIGAAANGGGGSFEIISSKEAAAILGVVGGAAGAGIGAAVARPAKTEIYRVNP